MSTDHFGGNIVPEITREEHDGANNAKRVNVVAGGVGQATVTLAPSSSFIGIVTVANQTAATLSGNVTLNPSPNFIGIVTVTNQLSVSVDQYAGGTVGPGNPMDIQGSVSITGTPTVFIGTPTLFAVVNTGAVGVQNSLTTLLSGPNQIGSVTISHPISIAGNLTLSDSKSYVGLVTVGGGYLTSYPQVWNGSAFEAVNRTVYIGLTTSTLGASPAFIGIVTVANTLTVNAHALTAGVAGIGFATVNIVNPNAYIGLVTSTLGVGTRFIGIVTVVQSSAARTITGNVTLSNSLTYIGLTTSTLGVGTQFIGLVTANSINTGTNKTLINLPIAFSASSIATIAVPANANRINITNLVLNSSATVRISFKSGVTYLTGNASIGITLNPGGGFPLTGAPDSPSWIGLPSGGFVIEKLDLTSTIASIGGNVIYFQEA